jgi:hypothetical protein
VKGKFQQAAIAAVDKQAAFAAALERAAQAVDIDRVGEPLVSRTNFLGVKSFRLLAFELCRWSEQEGILDKLFPLEAVEDDENA